MMDPLGTTDPLGTIGPTAPEPKQPERLLNRKAMERWLFREGFLDLPKAEFKAGLHLWGVIRELGLLSDRGEAERRLREPSGRSLERKDDMLYLASAAE